MPSQEEKGKSLARRKHFFHTEKSRSMRASVLCRIRKDRPRKDGYAPVFLQVIINREKFHIHLKVSWPVAFFDNSAGVFLPRFEGDNEADDYNMLARKYISKVNEIFIFYRHSDLDLTAELFHKEYSRFGARSNFIVWAETEIEDRYERKRIGLQTRKNARSSIKKIKQWRSEIKFSELNETLLYDLQAWLKNDQGMKINSVGSILKTVKIYSRAAYDQGLAVDMDNISKFKLPQAKGRVIFLTPEELTRMHRYYLSEEITPSHKRVLGQFLFATLTGLRYSDVERVSWKDIDGDCLDFEPYKTRNLEKRVRLPLTESAFFLIENERGKLFDTAPLQVTNRILKEIASKCNIRKNLTSHVARHTFATEFLRRGGAIEVLKEFLGHTKMETTMVYSHVDEARKREQIRLMEYQIFCKS
ncbi:site-specific integrase [Cyclobacterium xiamenense]|uniref:site-specific integrase n=1 Tax=Cyclobacterium xiamenense TaxID=1297121 RepID=UPI0035CF60FC